MDEHTYRFQYEGFYGRGLSVGVFNLSLVLLLQSKESFMRDLSTSRPLSSAEEVDKAVTELREKVNHL